MEKTAANQPSPLTNPKRAVWDCGSSLYDSFELKSLEKQLDAAIASRTLSMPHFSDDRRSKPPPRNKKTTSRLSRSLHRLIRSLFGAKSCSRGDPRQNRAGEGFHIADDRSGALSTIPEGSEFDGLSPEIRPLVRRTASERFADVRSIGFY